MGATLRQARRSATEVREKILAEATVLFIERGFEGASMNELNARVGGSKATLYAQFGSKEALFAAVLDHVLLDHMAQLDAVDLDGMDLREGLEEIARETLATVASPEALGLWRLLYLEAPRRPEIGRLFIERGPERSFAGIERFLRRQVRLGKLRCRRPEAAAEYFLGMVLHKPMLYRYVELQPPFTRAQLEATARRVTADFLRMCEGL